MIRYLDVWLSVLAAVSVIVAFVVGLRREAVGRKRLTYFGSLIVVAMLGLGGGLWIETALRHFAAVEKSSVRGLVAAPSPENTSDHRFTPNGQKYLTWSFIVPLPTVAVVVGIVAVIAGGIFIEFELRRFAFGVWAASIGALAAVGAFAFNRFLVAINLFV